MKILLTGAYGIVGRETLKELLAAGNEVRAFDLSTKPNRRQHAKIMTQLSHADRWRFQAYWGNLTDLRAIAEACHDIDAVIHLGALIPPAADRRPLEAYYVNVAATELLIQTLERSNPNAKLIFTSSISVFGDRRVNPIILPDDSLNPNDHDWYGRQKVLAEGVIHNSGLAWCILRLTYIVSPDKLQMDPLMFSMPLDTSIEICHARDVALALRHAAEGLVQGKLAGCTFQIAGGSLCRTSYREYLQEMFALFGLGRKWKLPESLWGTGPFHCAFMETTESQAMLHFQNVTLAEYYAEVGKVCHTKRFFIGLIRPLVWLWIKQRAPQVSIKAGLKTAAIDRLTGLMEATARLIAERKGNLSKKAVRGYP